MSAVRTLFNFIAPDGTSSVHATSLVGWCLQADRGVYRRESRNMEDDFRRRDERAGVDV